MPYKGVHKVSKMIEDTYELPTAAAVKLYISEIIDFMNSWANNYPLKHVAYKAINFMSSLLLLSHVKHLNRKIIADRYWELGNTGELYLRAKLYNSV